MLIVIDSQSSTPLAGVSATITNVNTQASIFASTDASGIIDIQRIVTGGVYDVLLEKTRYREDTVRITDISANYTVCVWPVMTFGL